MAKKLSILIRLSLFHMRLNSKIPLSFETDRLLVRRYQLSDEDNLYKSARASVSEVFEFLPWCHPDYSRGEVKEWLTKVEARWREAEAYQFAIYDKSNLTFHGGCGLELVEENPIANLGYWIKSSSIGKGIATEASAGLAMFGIERLKIQRLELIISTKNNKSIRVAEKLGAKLEGTLRNRLRLHEKIHDAHVYSIVPEDIQEKT